jgi:hypothetical protein
VLQPGLLLLPVDAAERLDSVVAEVDNTPWLQRHACVLRRERDEAVLRGAHDKVQTLLAKPGWRRRVPATAIAGSGGMEPARAPRDRIRA